MPPASSNTQTITNELELAAAPAPVRLGSYELLCRIGAGGMGTVYEAVHLEHGQRVALKTLTRADGRGLYRLKNEFRGLQDLLHPNLVRLYELGQDRETWFLTMEYVDGITFRCWTRPERYDGSRLLAALRQLVEGLTAIHEVGKVHRDIKASNVLIDRNGRLCILDFGLISDHGHSAYGQTVDHRIAGTLSHMAPELVRGQPATEASDWYAVGVMLYEALAGRLPFEDTQGDLFAIAGRGLPAPPSRFEPKIPPSLEELCLALLAPIPGERPKAGEIARVLQMPSDSSRGRSNLTALQLCGRERELNELRQVFEEVRDGRCCRAILVSGVSGIGKTALLDEYVRQLPQGTVVMRGRCYEREAIPFKALDGFIDDLSRKLSFLSEEQVTQLGADEKEAILRVFPVLARVPWLSSARSSTCEASEMRRRAILALGRLLQIAAGGNPCVIVIDDLQWGDEDSAYFLHELLSHRYASGIQALFAHREEDLDSSPFLKTFRGPRGTAIPLHRVSVEPLALDEAYRLVGHGWPPLNPKSVLIKRLVEDSRGVPFLLLEALEFARASVEERGEDTTSMSSVDVLVRRRVSHLDPRLISILEVLCVAAHPLARSVLSATSGAEYITDSDVMELQHHRLVRVCPDKSIEPYHDRIRAAIVDGMQHDRRRGLHAALANELEAQLSGPAVWVVEHWLLSGEETDRAAEQALVAARHAASALAFDRSAAFYRVALKREYGDAEKSQIFQELGDVLGSAGQLSEAADAYLHATETAGPERGAALRAQASQYLLLCGQLTDGEKLLEQIFPSLGLRLPKTGWGAGVAYLWNVLRLRLSGFTLRAQGSLDVQLLLQVDVCRTAGQALFVDRLRGAAIFSKGVLLALQTGDRARIAMGIVGHAAAIAHKGPKVWIKVMDLLGRGRALVKGIEDPLLEVRLLGAEAGAALLCGAFDDAATKHREVVQRAREVAGTQWEIGNAAIIGCAALYITGRTKGFAEYALSAVNETLTFGHRYTATMLRSHSAMGRLIQDDVAGASEELGAIQRDWPYAGFHGQHVGLLIGEVALNLYKGNALGAWALVSEMWPRLRGSLLMRAAYVRMDCESWCARAAVAALAQRHDKSLRRRALQLIKRLYRSAFPEATATAKLLHAGVTSIDRRDEAATHLLNRAEVHFEMLGRTVFSAVAASGCSDEQRRGKAEALLRDHDIVNPVAFARMYAPGIFLG